ncbi:MAG: RHS repeat domain-containing protein [Dehalococcoidia bacterium]
MTFSQFDYTYDAVRNRITRTTTNGIANYTYDALNRLTEASQPNPVDPLQTLTESFTYDPVGNRNSSHLAAGQLHDAANRLLEDSNFTFSSDANGNLIEQVSKASGDRTGYTYSVENQLIQAEKFTVAGGLLPVLTAAYRYDALGRRIGKEVTAAGSTTITHYVYDNADVLLEFDGSNIIQARYVAAPGIDEPLSMLRGAESFFYHVDGLGSVWDITDNTGNLIRSYTYDSFGQLIAQTGTIANPYTYTGREFDSETGLYYYRARYYDPSVGRFLQEDPLNTFILPDNINLNLYTYVENNPLILVDPLGLFALTSIDAAIRNCLAHPIPAERIKCLEALIGLGGLSPEAIAKCEKAIRQVQRLGKTADELISGALKAAKSYHSPYGSKTYEEILKLAKKGDRLAKQMKKLIEQGERLRRKLRGR